MIVLKLTVRSFCCLTLLLTLSPPLRQHFLAQSLRRLPPRRTPIEILDASREQDGLRGSVSSVRTEVARLSLHAGTVVEGRRSLLEVTRYDPAGRRIENQTYPIINTRAGQETHRYDEQGQLVETFARDARGALIRRTVYAYEYDSVGNWTKMIASVAVGESGGARLEPLEVTYRAIAYYNGERTDTNEVTDTAGAPPDAGGQAAASETAPQSSPNSYSAGADATPRMASPIQELGRGMPTAPAARLATDSPIEVGPINEMALSLPSPSYPVVGRRLSEAIKVTVEIVIDETGRILSARALDGPTRLRGAAEDAARAAIFMPFKIERKPVKVKGLLVYHFPFGR